MPQMNFSLLKNLQNEVTKEVTSVMGPAHAMVVFNLC